MHGQDLLQVFVCYPEASEINDELKMYLVICLRPLVTTLVADRWQGDETRRAKSPEAANCVLHTSSALCGFGCGR